MAQIHGHRFHRPNVGSISYGINKAKELVSAFSAELQQQRPLHDPDRRLLASLHAMTTANAVYALITALNGYAPDHYYFGPNENDSSDFGYWPITPLTQAALDNTQVIP